MKLARREFEALVVLALKRLPKFFKKKIRYEIEFSKSPDTKSPRDIFISLIRLLRPGPAERQYEETDRLGSDYEVIGKRR
jgi:hypothetical protein